MSTLTSFYDPGSDNVVPYCDLLHSWMKEFEHDFKGKGMKFCYHDPNSLPFLIQGILSLVDDISPTHFARGGGGVPRELLKIEVWVARYRKQNLACAQTKLNCG